MKHGISFFSFLNPSMTRKFEFNSFYQVVFMDLITKIIIFFPIMKIKFTRRELKLMTSSSPIKVFVLVLMVAMSKFIQSGTPQNRVARDEHASPSTSKHGRCHITRQITTCFHFLPFIRPSLASIILVLLLIFMMFTHTGYIISTQIN